MAVETSLTDERESEKGLDAHKPLQPFPRTQTHTQQFISLMPGIMTHKACIPSMFQSALGRRANGRLPTHASRGLAQAQIRSPPHTKRFLDVKRVT